MLPEAESSRKVSERKLSQKKSAKVTSWLKTSCLCRGLDVNITATIYDSHLYFDPLIKNMTYDQQRFDVMR